MWQVPKRIASSAKRFLNWVTLRDNLADGVYLLAIVCMSLVIRSSITDSGVNGIKPMVSFGYANEVRVSLDSFDPDTRRAVLTAVSKVYSTNPGAGSVIQIFPYNGEYKRPENYPLSVVRLADLSEHDLGILFQGGGIPIAQIDLSHGKLPKCSDPPSTPTDQKETFTWEAAAMPFLYHLFNNQFRGAAAYPFDRYLILGSVTRLSRDCGDKDAASGEKDWSVGDADEKNVIPSQLDITAYLPGYSIRSATKKDLEEWPTLYSSMSNKVWQNLPERARDSIRHPPDYDTSYWVSHNVAIVVTRPAYLRGITGLVLVITFAAVLILAVSTPLADLGRNFVMSVLTLWTARSILISYSPKQPTFLDLVVLFMFVIAATTFITRFIRGPKSNPADWEV